MSRDFTQAEEQSEFEGWLRRAHRPLYRKLKARFRKYAKSKRPASARAVFEDQYARWVSGYQASKRMYLMQCQLLPGPGSDLMKDHYMGRAKAHLTEMRKFRKKFHGST